MVYTFNLKMVMIKKTNLNHFFQKSYLNTRVVRYIYVSNYNFYLILISRNQVFNLKPNKKYELR